MDTHTLIVKVSIMFDGMNVSIFAHLIHLELSYQPHVCTHPLISPIQGPDARDPFSNALAIILSSCPLLYLLFVLQCPPLPRSC